MARMRCWMTIVFLFRPPRHSNFILLNATLPDVNHKQLSVLQIHGHVACGDFSHLNNQLTDTLHIVYV